MKIRTIYHHTLKPLLSVVCCLFFILLSSPVHGRQTLAKTCDSKKVTGQNTTTKTTEKKAVPSQQKKKPGPELTSKNTGKKSRSKQASFKKKTPAKMIAVTASEPRRNPFQYSPSDFSERVLQGEMKEYLGIPYRIGGTSTQGMDCSGFSRTVYASLFGVALPHNSEAQFSFPKLKKIDEDELQTGDLVFFSKKNRINHVGVYLGEGNFIHATNGKGIVISSLDDQHWKSRMFATKRLMSFDKTSMETLRLEGGFDIQLNTGNHIKSHVRDEFRPSNDSGGSARPYAYREADSEAYGLNDRRLYAYELEFSRQMWNDTCSVSMSGIREKLDKASAWNVYDREMDADWPQPAQPGVSSTTVRHGFKLASAITPIDGFSITPSVVYLKYDQPPHDPQIQEVPKRIFGLNTQFSPLAGPWSVAMAMHYADQLDMTDSLFKTSDLSNTMDMSFKLGYYFSKNLELSIMGKHDFKAVPGSADLTTSSDSPLNSDFLFKLDMKY